jgi:predicted N-acyltransferase
MYLKVVGSIDELPAAQWDRLAGTRNPFVSHAFLSALERTACVGEHSGWIPQHLLLLADSNRGTVALGAVPLYLKTHSYGEFVFDWAWANAYARAGISYYPKLVAAVPFTPVTGPRILVDEQPKDAADALARGALELARETSASSLHWLFTDEATTEHLEHHGFMRRVGNQFHWRNDGYADFDGFLATLSSKKRKQIRRERRQLHDAGVRTEVVHGATLDESDWDRFYAFYLNTIHEHGAIPYLTREFFHELWRTLADRVVMVVARRDGAVVAAALNLTGDGALYGRYWGCSEHLPGLHFETCYYRAIDHCIEHGIDRFEAGAQGEHKLSRGFMPSPTYSAHWIAQQQFASAIDQFLARERQGMRQYASELESRSPFRRNT